MLPPQEQGRRGGEMNIVNFKKIYFQHYTKFKLLSLVEVPVSFEQKQKCVQNFGVKTFAERIHLEDRCVDGKILKWFIKTFDGISRDGVMA
jgi:hypothetical protein